MRGPRTLIEWTIREEYPTCRNPKQLASSLGLTLQKLRYIVGVMGVTRKKYQPIEEVREMIEEGKSNREISKSLGISCSMVRAWRDRLGFPPSKARGKYVGA